MRSKYQPFPHGATGGHVSTAVALAYANCREDMTGFNVRSGTANPFSDVDVFVRHRLGRAANEAFDRMAQHLKGACVFRVTLTVSRSIRPDRRFHAAGLKTFMKGALREIRPSVVAYCGNLHVHRDDYLHFDATVVVREEDVEIFRRRARTSHTLGWRKRLGVRASTCRITLQGSLETDLRRSLDYTLRYDRYRCKPIWVREAIRALGVARASGFTKSRFARYPKTPCGAANPLRGLANLARNMPGTTLRTTQGTTKTPNVASRPKRSRRSRTPGRPPKRSHPAYRRGYRRDREARERDPANQISRSNQAKGPPRLAIALGLMSSTAVFFAIRPRSVGVASSPPGADGCILLPSRWKDASTRVYRYSGVGLWRQDALRRPQQSRSGKRPASVEGQSPAFCSFWPNKNGRRLPVVSQIMSWLDGSSGWSSQRQSTSGEERMSYRTRSFGSKTPRQSLRGACGAAQAKGV